MSLFRQLLLAIIASTLLAFAGSFVLSLVTARSYLENQLAIKNSDNANSLAISITQSPKDPVTIELMVSAQYDNGQYDLIRLTSPDGKVLAERSPAKDNLSDKDTSGGVPAWFRTLFPIVSRPGVAQISNGWNQFATIELVSQTQYAYQELWKGGIRLLLWFIGGGVLAGVLGSWLLRNLHAPLEAVVRQAKAIQDRRFEIIPVSTIPELKEVTQSTNAMVRRLKVMFEEEAARLESVRQEANIDRLTGLANRTYFMAHLHAQLVDDSTPDRGTVLIMRVANLMEINRKNGREVTDNLLKHCGEIFQGVAQTIKGSLGGRLNGADFALVLPNHTGHDQVADQILEEMRATAAASMLPGDNIAQIGLTYYQDGENIQSVISRVDQALAQAESKGYTYWQSFISGEPVSNMDDWKQLIEYAIKERAFKLVWFPTENQQGNIIHYECPIRMKKPGSDTWMVAGNFMPMASRLQITARIDLVAVELAIARLMEQPEPLAVNVSGESLIDDTFLPQLSALLKPVREDVRNRLWLEVPEVGVFEHFDSFVNFCRSLHEFKCKVGIEHFGHRFSQIGKLHDLGLDYIKVDGIFIRNLSEQTGNQAFLKGLCNIAQKIGIVVIAEGVQSKEEMDAVFAVGFDGVTGQALVAKKS